MSYDSYLNNEVSEGRNEIQESYEGSSEGTGLLVSICAEAAPRLDGTAQGVMDELLRECLKRKALMP